MTLENYIMEQEINTASFSDVMLEQAIAEFEVSAAILECYQKEEVLLEYASNASEFNVFMEEDETAAESTKKTFKERLGDAGNFIKEKGKAIGNAIKNGIKMLGEAIVNFVQKIFYGPDLNNLAKTLNEKWDKNAEFGEIPVVFMFSGKQLANASEKFLSQLQTNVNDKDAFEKIQNDLKEKLETTIGTIQDGDEEVATGTYTVSDIITALHAYGNARQDFINLAKTAKAAIKTYNKESDTKLDKETVKWIVGVAKALTKTYVGDVKAFNTIVKKASRDAKKAIKNSKNDYKRDVEDMDSNEIDDLTKDINFVDDDGDGEE